MGLESSSQESCSKSRCPATEWPTAHRLLLLPALPSAPLLQLYTRFLAGLKPSVLFLLPIYPHPEESSLSTRDHIILLETPKRLPTALRARCKLLRGALEASQAGPDSPHTPAFCPTFSPQAAPHTSQVRAWVLPSTAQLWALLGSSHKAAPSQHKTPCVKGWPDPQGSA